MAAHGYALNATSINEEVLEEVEDPVAKAKRAEVVVLLPHGLSVSEMKTRNILKRSENWVGG